jgi:hypothetical protein
LTHVFCPTCRDEFRSGFEHCARCNVDLVESLDDAPRQQASVEPPIAMPLRMAEYCGFFDLNDARESRDRVRAKSVRADIIIREPLDADLSRPAKEEYWLRVEAAQMRQAQAILGVDEAEEPRDSDTFKCSDCGRTVAAEESFCAGCGARFE